MARLGQRWEANGIDLALTFQQSPRDAMHAVHDPRVLDDLTNRRHLVVAVEPVRSVDLADRVHNHAFDRQVAARRGQSVDVPGVEALFSRPEVVLLPHQSSLAHGPTDRPDQDSCSRLGE